MYGTPQLSTKAPPLPEVFFPVQERLRVLVVEDNDFDRRLISGSLLRNPRVGYVRSVTNGSDCVDWLYSSRAVPHLLLLDISMPKMDGFEVLDHIVNMYGIDKIRTVMVSSSSRPQDMQTCLQAYAEAYLVKPGTLGKMDRATSFIVDAVSTGKPLPKLIYGLDQNAYGGLQ